MNNGINKGFSRYERNGIILLCFVIVVSILSKKYVVQYFARIDTLTANDKNKMAELQQQINAAKISYKNNYASIENAKEGSDRTAGYDTGHSNYEKNEKRDFKIEVNAATAEEYEKLYGIGKVLSQRIVTFRDKLGGFYSIEQIKDVWGIEDSVFRKFKAHLTIKPVKIKKVNINTATYEELTANPYFFSTVAKQIIGYRTKVKPFASAEDIKNLYFVRDHLEQFNKLAPYVVIN